MGEGEREGEGEGGFIRLVYMLWVKQPKTSCPLMLRIC